MLAARHDDDDISIFIIDFLTSIFPHLSYFFVTKKSFRTHNYN